MQVNQPLQTQGKAVQNDPLQMTVIAPELRIENRPLNLNVACELKNEMNGKTCSHCFLSAMTSLISF